MGHVEALFLCLSSNHTRLCSETSCLLPGSTSCRMSGTCTADIRVYNEAREMKRGDRMRQEALLLLHGLPPCSAWSFSLFASSQEAITEPGPESENWVMCNLAHKQSFFSPVQQLGTVFRAHKNKMSTFIFFLIFHCGYVEMVHMHVCASACRSQRCWIFGIAAVRQL